MIFFRPLGGLGNQLFTYANAKVVAQKHRTELVADLFELNRQTQYDFELQTFSSSIAAVTGDSESSRFAHQRGSNISITSKPTVVRERGSSFDPEVQKAQNGSLLVGYFQSWKYFHSIADSLRRELRLIKSPTSWFLERYEELSSTSWTAVSVRRGDYLKIRGMGLVHDDYYQRAISLIDRLNPTELTMVFAQSPDDISSIPSLKRLKPRNFVIAPPESSPIESMVLQSLAKNAILANSTYSWWSAWLGDSADGIVTYPVPWGDFHSINDRDRHLPSWIGMGRESLEQAAENSAVFPGE